MLYQSGESNHVTGGMRPSAIAFIPRDTFGRPYPYCRSQPCLPAHGSVGSAMSDAVARITCTASAAVNGLEISCCAAACFPSASSSAATPPTVGVDVDVVPPMVAAENMLCVPHEV